MIGLGIIISLLFLYIGIKFTFFPQNAVRYLQRIKYKETGGVDKREKIFSIIMGVIFIIIGLYFMTVMILSLIYPAT